MADVDLSQGVVLNLVTPLVQDMMENPGFYVAGDADLAGANMPIVSQDGRLFKLAIDRPLDPRTFKDSVMLKGPYVIGRPDPEEIYARQAEQVLWLLATRAGGSITIPSDEVKALFGNRRIRVGLAMDDDNNIVVTIDDTEQDDGAEPPPVVDAPRIVLVGG